MTSSAKPMDQYAAAAHGLAISAGGAALSKVLQIAADKDAAGALTEVTRLLEKAQKAATCMVIAQKAEQAGDTELAERSWTHALNTMDILASETAVADGQDTQAEQTTIAAPLAS